MAIPGNSVQVMAPFDERLASLPDVARRVTAGDGTEPTGASSSSVAPPVGKTLADPGLSASVKFSVVEQLMRSQDALGRNRYAIDTHFRRIRSGVPFSRLEKVPNQSVWVQKLPTGMTKESSASVPNKADDLCNKIEDTLMADPPKPDPQPHVSDESAKEAAELMSEYLLADGGEAGTNDTQTYRWALNNALTAASSFCHYVVDRTGGGYQPMQVLAHPLATDPANPLVASVPTPGAQGAVPMEERAVNPILRYVGPPTPQSPSGTFVENAEQADRVWLPKIRIERYRRESVRLFPATATVEDAKGAILIRFMTLADARAEWPETVGQMDQEALLALATFRPVQSELVVPFAFRGALASGATGPSLEEVGSVSPLLQRRMFSYRFYLHATPEYPEGYWLDVTGANGGQVLGEGTLEYQVTLPTHGKTKRCRDIPLTQTRPQQDADGGDPMGWPLIARFAGPSEAEQTLYAAFQDMCDNMLHPHVFLPSTTAVDEDDWMDRTRPIVLGPTDKQPFYEQFPALPPVLDLIENMDRKMDTSSGLTATAQGLDTPDSVSGVAKNLSIRQALVSLSGIQQNLHAAMTRGWRIKGQLAQAEFSTPQMMQFAGDAGSSQPRWWTGEDLAGVDRVGIQPGTGTMMTPEGKAQYVAFLQGQQWMTPEDAAKVALPGITMDLGIPENPFKQAIERAVAVWLQGPTEDWLQAKAQQDEATQAAQAQYQQESQMADPALPLPVFQPPQQPPLPTPFTPKPNDSELRVATVYAQRLSELLVDPQYEAQPPSWRALVDDAYGRYMQALQPPPVLPKGVAISVKGDANTVGAEEQAAIQGLKPPAPGAPGSPPAPGAPTGGVPMPKAPQQPSAPAVPAGIPGPHPGLAR